MLILRKEPPIYAAGLQDLQEATEKTLGAQDCGASEGLHSVLRVDDSAPQDNELMIQTIYSNNIQSKFNSSYMVSEVRT